MRTWLLWTVAAACVVITGCSSQFVPLAPQMAPDVTPLGHASGRACGVVLPFAGCEQFLPILAAGRMERAYDAALHSVAGATALRDVSIQDHYGWPILWFYICTTISGEAVR